LKNLAYLLVTIFLLAVFGCATTSDLKEVQSDLNKKVDEKLTAMEADIAAMKKSVDATDVMRKGQANTAADLTDLRDNLNQLRGQLEALAANAKKQEQQLDNLLLKINFIENFLEIGPKNIPTASLEKGKSETDTPDANKSKATDKDRAYSSAYNTFREGNYSKARTEFQNFLAAYPKSEYSDNAQFWIGECYFFENKYEQAILAYQEVITKYPNGNKTPNAMLKQALAFIEIRDTISAKLLLQKVVKKYPGSNVAKTAEAKLKTLK
jgi:tol-pal system protein YbgF